MQKLVVAMWFASASYAAPPPEPYTSAVRLVDRLFLEPETIDASTLLRAAALGLSSDVHWLMVDPGDHHVRLSHGSGTPLGTVTVEGMDDLPRALANLEQLAVQSGHPTAVDVRLSVLQGMTGALDRYSKVLAGDKLDRFNVRLKGTLLGIGATFDVREQTMFVRSVVAEGPAKRGGLLVGDRVLRIDGRSTVNMPLSEAVRRVRGEAETQVVLTVRRGVQTMELGLSRKRIVVPNVTHRVLEGDVGYVRIDHISQQTVSNLRKALDDLADLGAMAHGLVVDLRGNTGGSMKEAARSADQFLEDGLLLRTVGHDGGRVQNLQAEMQASKSGSEPQIPIVVLMDRRTASGSEILAGALLELERAALVGTLSYGKGTVQKIYNLDDDMRLKLTVARYVLANERHIADAGLHPDVTFGEVHLDGYGMRLPGWEQPQMQAGWHSVVPELHEQQSWRSGAPPPNDLAEELARRAVLSATGTSRAAVLTAVEHHASLLRAHQQTALTSALQAKGIDWTPAPEDASFIDATVEVVAQVQSADTLQLRVSVTHNGKEPLHRALVHLTSDTAPWWTGVAVPIGRVAPGATATAETLVPLVPGVEAREDAVSVYLRADRRPPLLAGDTVLASRSSPEPRLQLSARLVPHGEPAGDSGWPVMRAEVTVNNLSRGSVTGVEVHFGFPDDGNVELIDYASRTPLISGRTSERLDLALEVGPDAPPVLPLEVVVEAERYRGLVQWPLALPTDGSTVTLQAPLIETPRLVTTAAAGPYPLPIVITDDGRVDHAVVFANGAKVAWEPGFGPRLQLTPTVDLRIGANRIVVTTTDDQGLTERRSITIRGEEPAVAVEATE